MKHLITLLYLLLLAIAIISCSSLGTQNHVDPVAERTGNPNLKSWQSVESQYNGIADTANKIITTLNARSQLQTSQ